MTDQPIFVSVIRSIIPQGGANLSSTTAARVKRKVKKGLEKANYQVETVRGIGIKFSYYGLTYREKDNTLFADFCRGDEMPVKSSGKKSRGKRSSKSKKSPLIAERDPQTSTLTHSAFIEQVFLGFPKNWRKSHTSDGKWMTFDIGTLRDTGKSPEEVVKYVMAQVNDRLNVWDTISYTLLKISDRILLGVSV